MKLVLGIGLVVLFFAVLFLSAVLIFRQRKTVTYTYAQNELTSAQFQQNVNLL